MFFPKLILLLGLAAASVDDERYSPDEAPPESGWQSAVKFFKKDGSNSVQKEESEKDSDASNDSVLFLDNIVFVKSENGSELDSKGRWGLRLGYEWDPTWFAQGIYLRYNDYQDLSKFSLLTGFVLPANSWQFPLYLRANFGLGYFAGPFTSNTLTVDYNASVGIRFFSDSRWLFNVELESNNYHRLFKKSYSAGWAISSGLAFMF